MKIFIKLITTLLLSATFLSAGARCITGNTCISSETGEYVFHIDLPENIDSIYWCVKGGIEIVNSTQESVTVKSKNTIEGNQKYSKGRIYCYAYVRHNINGDCSFSHSVLLSQKDVYKSFGVNGSILGLSAVSAGDTCLYSIKPFFTDMDHIGMDSYYWEFSSGFSKLYTSADGSAIALKADSLSGNDTIKVTAGQCNTGNPNNQLALIIGENTTHPVIPPVTPPNQNTCSAEVVPYTVPDYGADVYFTVVDPTNVIIKVYDTNDNYIHTAHSAYMWKGRQTFYFRPTNLASGETYKFVIEMNAEICVTDFVVK